MTDEWDRASKAGDFLRSIDQSTLDEQSAGKSDPTLQYHNVSFHGECLGLENTSSTSFYFIKRATRNPLLRRSSTLPRVWRSSHYPIYFQTDPQDSASPPYPDEPVSLPSSNEGMSTAADLFVDTEGNLLDLPLESIEDPPPYDSIHPLGRVDTKLSIVSMWSVRAVADISLPLNVFASLIARHSSLQSIEIASSEAYRITHQGITHRFLVLELRRPKKPTVWLRLDRRPQDGVNLFDFVFASGETPANDSAIFSTDKGTLIHDSTQENRQTFEQSITLDDLRHLIVIIIEELVVYQLWPANCWFFVSLIQQYLQGHAAGSFVDGSSKWGDTAYELRKRVRERVRLVYHMPRMPTVYEILVSFGDIVLASDLSLASKNPWTNSNDFPRSMAIGSGLAAARDLDGIAGRLNAGGFVDASIMTRRHLLRIARELIRRADMAWARRKITSSDTTSPHVVVLDVRSYFQKLGKQLEGVGAFSEAVAAHREAVALYEQMTDSATDVTLAKLLLAEALFCLGRSLHRNSPKDVDEALSLLRRSVMLEAQARTTHIEDGPNYRTLVLRLSYLGNALLSARAYSEAAEIFAEAAPKYHDVLFQYPPLFNSHFIRDLEGWAQALLSAGEYNRAFRHTLKLAVTLRKSLMPYDQAIFDRVAALFVKVGEGLYVTPSFFPATDIFYDLMDYMLAGVADGLSFDRHIPLKVLELPLSSLLTAASDAILDIIGPIHPHIPVLAQSIVNWADALGRCDGWPEAEQILDDYLAKIRPLIDAHPRYFRSVGASVMSSMAKLLERHGRAEESLSFYRESITLTREDCISETRMLEPTQGTRVLVMRLVNFGFAFQRTPSPDQALPILQEAVTHLRILIAELTAREDEGLQETFGLALFRIGTIFYNAQSPREALSPLRESFDVFKKLDAAWVPLKYQRSLRNVADYLQKVVNLLDDGKSEDLIEIKGMLGGLRP